MGNLRVNLWHLAELLEWEILTDKFIDGIRTQIFLFNKFFRLSNRLWDNVEKCGTAGEITD